ncbi:MAG: hypothetical protein ACTSYK_07175 [Alphaproteobacteria bacterium]|jgi:hypothetical protein
MEATAQALANPLVRGLYLGFCLALLIVPLLALWLWYRKRTAQNALDRFMLRRVALLDLL